jgi:hypothetical protein
LNNLREVLVSLVIKAKKHELPDIVYKLIKFELIFPVALASVEIVLSE